MLIGIQSFLAAIVAAAALSVGFGATAAQAATPSQPGEFRGCPVVIKRGATGGCVLAVQRLLNQRGANLAADGRFGARTVTAVKAFQKRARIADDGVVGPATKRALATQPVRVPQRPAPAGTPGSAGGVRIAQLQAILPAGPASMAAALPYLNAAMAEAGIVGPRRQAAFLATMIAESNLNYDALERMSATCARYGGGCTYRGRGMIQLTHKANYQAAAGALGVDLVANPEEARSLATSPRVAAWFWTRAGLNAHADQLDMYTIMRRINGGSNGCVARWTYFNRALVVLNAAVPPQPIRC